MGRPINRAPSLYEAAGGDGGLTCVVYLWKYWKSRGRYRGCISSNGCRCVPTAAVWALESICCTWALSLWLARRALALLRHALSKPARRASTAPPPATPEGRGRWSISTATPVFVYAVISRSHFSPTPIARGLGRHAWPAKLIGLGFLAAPAFPGIGLTNQQDTGRSHCLRIAGARGSIAYGGFELRASNTNLRSRRVMPMVPGHANLMANSVELAAIDSDNWCWFCTSGRGALFSDDAGRADFLWRWNSFTQDGPASVASSCYAYPFPAPSPAPYCAVLDGSGPDLMLCSAGSLDAYVAADHPGKDALESRTAFSAVRRRCCRRMSGCHLASCSRRFMRLPPARPRRAPTRLLCVRWCAGAICVDLRHFVGFRVGRLGAARRQLIAGLCNGPSLVQPRDTLFAVSMPPPTASMRCRQGPNQSGNGPTDSIKRRCQSAIDSARHPQRPNVPEIGRIPRYCDDGNGIPEAKVGVYLIFAGNRRSGLGPQQRDALRLDPGALSSRAQPIRWAGSTSRPLADGPLCRAARRHQAQQDLQQVR